MLPLAGGLQHCKTYFWGVCRSFGKSAEDFCKKLCGLQMHATMQPKSLKYGQPKFAVTVTQKADYFDVQPFVKLRAIHITAVLEYNAKYAYRDDKGEKTNQLTYLQSTEPE